MAVCSDTECIICPFCKNIARVQIRKDAKGAVLLNFPLYCPRRKKGALIDVEKFHITFITQRAEHIDLEPTNVK